MPPNYQDSPRKISFVRLGLVVVVVVGLGMLVWAIFFRTSQTNQASVSGSIAPQSSQTQSSPQATTQQKSGSGGGASVSSQPAATTPPVSSSSSAANQGQSQQLSNTGPGNTLAVFAGVALAGALSCQLYVRRRAARKA